MVFILFLLVFFVGGGWVVGKAVGSLFFPESSDNHNEPGNTFIDNSVHHHFHVHDSSKSVEIKRLGEYVDNLHDDTDYEDIT